MPFGFGYLCNFVMFYFFFLQKEENNSFKKASRPKFCNIFLFWLKIESVGPVDQQINLVSLNNYMIKYDYIIKQLNLVL